jgi:hypothetical protein
LDALVLPEPYASRLASQRRILAALTAEITLLEVETANRLKDNSEYRSLLTIDGIGPVLAGIFVAEIGDVHRFSSADQLACWAGLTTRLDSSDAKTSRGHVSKQGSRLLRWAAVERAREPYLAERRRAIVARRGTQVVRDQGRGICGYSLCGHSRHRRSHRWARDRTTIAKLGMQNPGVASARAASRATHQPLSCLRTRKSDPWRDDYDPTGL